MSWQLALLAYIFLLNVGPTRVNLVLSVPPIALDCLVNWVCGESWRTTLSAKAYDTRINRQKYWWWWAYVIDVLFFFQKDHCKTQWLRERMYGGVWKAWKAEWRGNTNGTNGA